MIIMMEKEGIHARYIRRAQEGCCRDIFWLLKTVASTRIENGAIKRRREILNRVSRKRVRESRLVVDSLVGREDTSLQLTLSCLTHIS